MDVNKLILYVLVASFALTLTGCSDVRSFGVEKYQSDTNKLGVFIGSYGQWSGYITTTSNKRKGSYCRLIQNIKDDRKVFAEFKYGNQKDFRKQLERTAHPSFIDESSTKTKELLKQLCILKNAAYSIKHANPDFILCARDEPKSKIVLWNFSAVKKEGFFSVENRVIDGIAFIEGNGYRPDYYYTESGGKGDRYLDMYQAGPKKIYTQILMGYAKNQLWYASADQCERLIEVSSCRANFGKKGFDRKLFHTILAAADGLWSRQFCGRE